MPDSQRYPENLCLIKYEFEINVYNFKTDYFLLWFLYKHALFITATGKQIVNTNIQHF